MIWILPIKNEFIECLANQSEKLPVELKEGYFWFDRRIIRAFDKNGVLRSLCKVNITKDLIVTYKTYKDTRILMEELDFESWEETYNRHRDTIALKLEESVQVVKDMIAKYPNHKVILATSKGKDSNLTDYVLEKAIGDNYTKIFNNTTMDCSDVYRSAKSDSRVEIVTPKLPNGKNRSFYKMVQDWGIPSRHSRWCCSCFKSGGTIQRFKDEENLMFVMGMRNEESSNRKDYGFEYFNEAEWTNSSCKTWIGCLPIRRWTEIEVWLFEMFNGIEINPKYDKGYSRCGCHIVCPERSEMDWMLDKHFYPVQYKRYHDILDKDFVENEKWYRMNCTQQEYHSCWNGGILRVCPTDEVVQEFQQFKGIEDIVVAKQYFNKECSNCVNKNGKPKKIIHKDVIAMNMKYHGRNINTYLCKKCLMKELEMDLAQWDKQVEEFKSQGCKLF